MLALVKLYHTPTSPFVRKVMVTAHELGLEGRIETTFLRPSPLKADAALSHENPLSKIPVLVTPEHGPLFDSAVICEYLDQLAGGGKIIPAGPARFPVLRTHALCDGIVEAGVLVFYEKQNRPAEMQFEPWVSGQREKANQGLDALAKVAADWADDAVDLGRIAAGCVIGWLEFRNVLGDLRTPTRAPLFAWYDRFAKRSSMVATAPHA
jgi:glutathione S-transferase